MTTVEIIWDNENVNFPMAIIERDDEVSGRCHLVKNPNGTTPKTNHIILLEALGDEGKTFRIVVPGIDAQPPEQMHAMEIVRSSDCFSDLADYYIQEWAQDPKNEKRQFMSES